MVSFPLGEHRDGRVALAGGGFPGHESYLPTNSLALSLVDLYTVAFGLLLHPKRPRPLEIFDSSLKGAFAWIVLRLAAGTARKSFNFHIFHRRKLHELQLHWQNAGVRL